MASFLRVSLVLLSFIMVVSTQERDCQEVNGSGQDPLMFSDPNHSTSLQIHPDAGDDQWDAIFRLGQIQGDTFEYRHEMEIRRAAKSRNKSQFTVRLFKKGNRADLLADERLSKDWFGDDSKIGFRLVPSGVKLEFSKGGTQLVLQVSDHELRMVDSVALTATITQALQCSLPTPATTTTTRTVTSTSTTSPPVTTSGITTTPQNRTITPSETLTTRQNNTLSTSNSEATTPSVNVAGIAGASEEECHAIPWWTWTCAGLAVAFFIILWILLGYVIVLHRRNWKLSATIARQGQHLRGRMQSKGGYGEETQDMQYYSTNNQNLMVGSTMPRIVSTPSPLPPLPSHCMTGSMMPHITSTPSPLPPMPAHCMAGSTMPRIVATPSPLPPMPAHCTAPRNSTYRKSFSHQPIINFPEPPSGSPPLPSFQQLSPDACFMRPQSSDFPSESDPLNIKKTFHYSEDGLADDEVSDVSLSGEYGLK